MDDPDRRPGGSNADEWAMFLDDHRNADGFLAVQIAEAIEEAERRGMMRAAEIARKWPEHDTAWTGIAIAIESAATEEGE